MAESNRTPLSILIRAEIEHFIVSRMVPAKVGNLMRLVFKTPVWLYQSGFGRLVPRKILILTTIGRKTGKPRMTAVEYGYDAAADEYFLMSGWGGRSDWYRNARANPRVQIWFRDKKIDAVARQATNDDVVKVMQEVLAINPHAVRTWSSHSGVPYDGTRNSLLQMAPAFPSLLVSPVQSPGAEE